MGEKFTCARVIEALRETHGIQCRAAEKLGCHRNTVARYIRDHPTVAAAYASERETLVDLAEEGIYDKVVEKDAWALQFVARTLGKDRGYVEKQEIAQTVDIPVDSGFEKLLDKVYGQSREVSKGS